MDDSVVVELKGGDDGCWRCQLLIRCHVSQCIGAEIESKQLFYVVHNIMATEKKTFYHATKDREE